MPLTENQRRLCDLQESAERIAQTRKQQELDGFIADVRHELERAERNHAPMNSLHEAYSVILEEVDELWDLVRMKRQERNPEHVRSELLQIAAMAIRTAKNLDYLTCPVEQPFAYDDGSVGT